MDIEIFILLVLMSTHLLAFGTGWALHDAKRRHGSHHAG
jgi:hypothetical protein